MEIPKFGTRLNTPEPPTQEIYKAIDEILDDKVDQQNDYYYSNEESDQNLDQNDYQNGDPKDGQNFGPLDQTNENPIETPNPNPSPQQFDNVDNDQYYTYYDDQTQDNVESKDSPKSVIYTQTTAHNHKSDERLDISSNSSSPLEISHKIVDVMNWREYDSGQQPLN